MTTWAGLKCLILVAASSAIPSAKNIGDDYYQINITASNKPNSSFVWLTKCLAVTGRMNKDKLFVKVRSETYEYRVYRTCLVEVWMGSWPQEWTVFTDGSWRSDTKLVGQIKAKFINMGEWWPQQVACTGGLLMYCRTMCLPRSSIHLQQMILPRVNVVTNLCVYGKQVQLRLQPHS